MFSEIRSPLERLRAVVDAATNDANQCFNPQSSLIRYIKSADQVVNTAHWKKSDGALVQAFYIYVKFSTLYYSKVKAHSAFRTLHEDDQRKIIRLISISLDEAEKLKPVILKQFEQEEARRKEFEAAEAAIAEERERDKRAAEEKITRVHRQHHDDAVFAQQLQQEERYAVSRGHGENVELSVSQVINSHQREQFSGAPSNPLESTPTITGSIHHSALFPARKVHLPTDLNTTFLRLALNNTTKNIETCGILCAPNSNDMQEFHVSHILIPPQCGTPDSCVTEDEEKLFHMTDKLNLIVIGWIHTHPSQTAFLSSVDLHTQAGYQQLFSESVAVVCSVKFDDNKIFRLTPSGLDIVSGCSKVGFHEHPGSVNGEPLFEECSLKEISWDADHHIQIVDLRF